MLNNVVNRYLTKHAAALPPMVMQTANNLMRKYKGFGLRVGVNTRLFSNGPDYILTFSGNTFPFAAVFKKFRMMWDPALKAWWVPLKNWRAVEAQFDAALEDEVKKKQPQSQPQQQPKQYPWSKGEVWLSNTEVEDEAEDTGYLFKPMGADFVLGKPTFMSEEYEVPPKRMSNEEAMRVWERLIARRYEPVVPRSWRGIY